MKSIINIIKLLRDTFILPKLNSKISQFIYGKYDYAFLIHPRDYSDYIRQFPIAKIIPPKFFSLLISYLGPFVISSIEGLYDKNGKKKRGLLVGVLATPEILYNRKDEMRQKIVKAANICEKLGVKIVGLGALIASVTSRGKFLVSRVDKIGVTTGHAFTAVTVINNLNNILNKTNLDRKKLNVAIVGAAGSVGSACFRLLIKNNFKNFILIDSKIDLLKKRIVDIPNEINFSIYENIDPVINADIIITATNAPYAVLHSKMVKPGTIILDDAQPSDLDTSLEDRMDILTVEAGLARLPNINCNFNFGLLYPDDIFGCLGETIILTWQGWSGHFVIDDVTEKHIDEVIDLSKKVGFLSAELRGFKKVYHDEDIHRVAKIIGKNKNDQV